MNQPYIFESSQNNKLDNNEAIIVLPDIYCQTDYSKRTVEEFALAFGKSVFLVDYFFLATGQANNFSENDREKVHDIMENFTADEFIPFFQKVIIEIKQSYPKISSLIVICFCFGGRLAYLSGG